MKMFANLLIVGATKGGTTSVFRYLAEHGSVCASSRKEINFFTRFPDDPDRHVDDEYAKYFKHCTTAQPIRVEASPVYLSGGKWIAKRIHEYIPDARLVFILREPVSRYLSHFKFWLAKTENVPEGVGIAEAIRQGLSGPIELGRRTNYRDWSSRATQLIRCGCYARALRDYLEVFPSDRICVLFFEDLAADPRTFMQRLCRFADIDPSRYDNYSFTVENKTRVVRNKRLHKAIIEINNRLQPLLNRLPAVRRAVRKVYFLVNRDSGTPQLRPSADELELLIEFYRKENLDLRALLERHYPSMELPDWLQSKTSSTHVNQAAVFTQ